MITFRVKADMAAFRRAGIEKAKDMRLALDDAALYLAAAARKRIAEVAARVFDRPTAFTMAGFAYRRLPGNAPAALVYIMPEQAKYLQLEVDGGERHTGDYNTTSRGILLPGRDVVLDSHGNMPAGIEQSTLSAGGRWLPARDGKPDTLVLPGKGKLQIIAVAVPVAHYESRLPFYDIIAQVIAERSDGALDYVLRQ